MAMNIVLCGMTGVGKSSVGERIARLTGRSWLDTDVVISTCRGSISKIFEMYGEAYFRALETEIVKDLSEEDGLVISTGGGLVLNSENVALLKKKGKIFYLRARLETLLTRVYADETRPLLKGTGGTAETLGELLLERTPVYEQVADYIIDTDSISIEETAAKIIELAEKK